jgi:hypothetical protein
MSWTSQLHQVSKLQKKYKAQHPNNKVWLLTMGVHTHDPNISPCGQIKLSEFQKSSYPTQSTGQSFINGD